MVGMTGAGLGFTAWIFLGFPNLGWLILPWAIPSPSQAAGGTGKNTQNQFFSLCLTPWHDPPWTVPKDLRTQMGWPCPALLQQSALLLKVKLL